MGLAVTLLVTCGLVLLAGPAKATSDATTSLAQKFAPILVVREQPVPCGEGEPYRPTPVDTVLGQDDVLLRGPDGQAVAAPSAADLAGKGQGWYLDFPGNPLSTGCDQERWFKGRSAGVEPTLYARLATDPAHPDKLALQYWFFYTYNDWNDKHEGDWEMVQVVLPAATAEAALAVQPESVAYAQHEGSQVSDWDARGLIRVGDHPVVYPGQGSHAAYYAQQTWFGKSASAGFGCDNTTPPGVEVTPRIVVLPRSAPSSGPFAWLSYTGRWGEQAPSFNNGPTGPVTKAQWSEPITWMEQEGRTKAVALPAVPSAALRGFCDLTRSGSLLYIGVLDQPGLVAGILLALVVLIVVLALRTRWRHARSDTPELERRAGQILLAAFGWARRHAGALAGAGGVLAATSLTSAGAQLLLQPQRDPGDITGAGLQTGSTGIVVLAVLAVLVIGVVGWVAASVISLVGEDAAGRPLRAGSSLRAGLSARSAILAQAMVMVAALLLAGSVILIPVAAWLVARYSVAPAAAVLEGQPLRGAFRRSALLTKGRRWRTLLLQVVLVLVGTSLPSLAGALLLLFTNLPFWALGLISVAFIAALMPVTFTGLALQYYDLRLREHTRRRPRDPARQA